MTHCRFVSTTQPRMVCSADHERGAWCEDCEVCRGPHCRSCGIAHVEHVCGECLADTRQTLAAIAEMCGALPAEVQHRGVEGEAMSLLGPAADPEARGHLEASVMAGRVPADYLGDAMGDTHPLVVCGTWEMVYRSEFDHDEATMVALPTAIAYLGANLTYASTWPHVAFEDMARDLRRCRAHLEAVLHDSGRGERANIDCLDCGAPLERKLGKAGFDDVSTCSGCRRVYTSAEYHLAVRRDYIKRADWLTDADMAIRTGAKPGTVRVWAKRGTVEKRDDHGRVVYSVTDVEKAMLEKVAS